MVHAIDTLYRSGLIPNYTIMLYKLKDIFLRFQIEGCPFKNFFSDFFRRRLTFKVAPWVGGAQTRAIKGLRKTNYGSN